METIRLYITAFLFVLAYFIGALIKGIVWLAYKIDGGKKWSG